ncbi:MAG: hypothetical protein IH899_16000, partial [Planctomycetes bacterium]|nr:hypothetical protein [Planctomycetota bacterium]
MSSEHRAVPVLHFLVHFGAVSVFYAALRSQGLGRWIAVVIAGSLLYSNLLFRYTAVVSPDTLACSMAILNIACLFLVIQSPRKAVFWLGFMISLFATYQMRPAYLFLVPVVPMLGVVLLWLRPQIEKQLLRRITVGLVLVSVLPLLGFCCVRWHYVGHFGLVSFGGYSLIGVTGQFLTEDVIHQLPEELQPLARNAHEKKRKLIDNPNSKRGGNPLAYSSMESNCDTAIYDVFLPAAQELYGDDSKLINHRLSQLATAILRAKPQLYALWLAKAFRQGIRMIVTEFVMNLINLAVVCLLIMVEGWYVFQRRLLQEDGSDQRLKQVSDRYFIPVHVLGAVAVVFAISKLVLVMLVAPPLGRYMDAAGVFLPVVAVAILCYRIEAAAALRRDRLRSEQAA